MGVTKPLDKEINHYLGHLNMQQKRVVLSVVKTFAGEEESWWENKEFVKEMDKRFAEMETGKVKLYTLEEAETKARRLLKNGKSKK